MKLMNIVKAVWDTEGFAIQVKHDGSLSLHVEQQEYKKRSLNCLTVEQWIDQRFRPSFLSYGIVVLKGNGSCAAKSETLGNVRDSYMEE